MTCEKNDVHLLVPMETLDEDALPDSKTTFRELRIATAVPRLSIVAEEGAIAGNLDECR